MLRGIVCRIGRARLSLALLASGALFAASQAQAAIATLFTTQQDFTGWTNGGGSPVVTWGPSGLYDSDGSSVNGVGNNTAAGAAGTPGSLQINTGANGINYTYTVFSPNLSSNPAALAQVDPGYVVGGGLVAASSTMYMTYTNPTMVGPNAYAQVGVDLSYAPNYYNTYFPATTINDGIIDGLQTYTAVIAYNVTAGPGTGFSISPFFNAGVYGTGVAGVSNVLVGPFYVDNIGVTAQAVPEPATIGLLTGGMSLLALRRRKA
jgi:hypothetical protein